ncbi:NAD-P-binding protein [Trametes elegans]|nr:NAD-P-binding protein [Trametes elegans]
MSASSRPTTWLITGASRGIGLELARQLLASPDNVVVGTVRDVEKATALSGLKSTARGTLHIIKLDLDNFDEIRASAKDVATILGDAGLDYLVNNAGICLQDTPFEIDPEVLLRHVRTNVAAPAVVAQAYLPLVEKSAKKTVVNISSTMGSHTAAANWGPGATSYSISKAALNMLTVKEKFARPDLTFISLCPGWVKTDMGTQAASLEPHESVAGILKVLGSLTPADSGKFLRYEGAEVPW